MNLIRLQRDFATAKQNFDYLGLYKDDRDRVYVKAALRTTQGRDYAIKIMCEGYPNKSPVVFVAKPALKPSPHRYTNDGICYMHPNRWNPGIHDIKFVIGRVAKWLHKYETYRATGRWPGAGLDHEPA